jgi:hypothetical protein
MGIVDIHSLQREVGGCKTLVFVDIEPALEQQEVKPIVSATSDGSHRYHGHVGYCLQ